jgi:exonuclease VII large subunit
MTDLKKVEKFTGKLHSLISRLEKEKDHQIHSRINQFQHMQRAAELTELKNQLDVLQKRMTVLSVRLDEIYISSFYQWKADLKWLHSYLRSRKKAKAAL